MSDIQPYSKAIVLLLKKTVENNSPEWENICTFRSEIQKYLSVIGLELVLKEEEGFAYVKQIVMEDDTTLEPEVEVTLPGMTTEETFLPTVC